MDVFDQGWDSQALDILRPYRDKINLEIPHLLREYVDDSNFRSHLEAHFGTTGSESTISHSKRLRGSLCMIVAESLGIQLERIIPFACSLEFFHAASLIIDDIQDNSCERVGKRTVWEKIGKSRAINVGFYFKDTGHRVFHKATFRFPSANIMMNSYIHKVFQEIAVGQDMDLCSTSQWQYGMAGYEKIAAGKTGRLIGLSLCLPFLLVGKGEEIESLSEFAKSLGVVHQLNDDIDELSKHMQSSNNESEVLLDPGNVVFYLKAPSCVGDNSPTDPQPIPLSLIDSRHLFVKLRNALSQTGKDLLERSHRLPLPRGKPRDDLVLLSKCLVERNTPLLQRLSLNQGESV